MPPPARATALALALLAGLSATACSDDPAGAPDTPPDAVPTGKDPVERAADATLRTLLDIGTLAPLIETGGAERLSERKRTALAAWIEALRAAAPAAPALSYRLDPDRYDPATGTWPVDVQLPGLAAALEAPQTRLVIVLEPVPGTTGAGRDAAAFHIVEARLALR